MRGQRELEDILESTCTRCGACVKVCPYIGEWEGEVVVLFPCTLSDGRCYTFCPRTEGDLYGLSRVSTHTPLGVYKRVAASQSRRRGSFQSGGTVSALMRCALKEGFIDAAVLTGRDGFLPVPRVVTDCRKVEECATSTYTAAPTLSALNEAVRTYGNVGVVATPCQCLAVAKMRQSIRSIKVVVGLFCSWALDYRKFEQYASDNDVRDVVMMKIPPPPSGIMEMCTREGVRRIPLDEIRPLILHACSSCPDLTCESSDVSVGELESDDQWNTLIVRTERGEELVEAAVRKGYLRVREMPPGDFEHLKEAARKRKELSGIRRAKKEREVIE